MTRELRDYQTEAVEAVRSRWAAGTNRTAVVMATGLGKSSVAGKIATDEAAAGGRALILAHRSELLDQLRDTCRSFRSDIAVGRVQAEADQRLFPITVAMVQTLGSETRRARMPRPTVIVYDECHHAASPTSVEILQAMGAFDDVRTLGVTATMSRTKQRGLGLGDVWGDEVAFARDIRWAVSRGWLVPPRGRVVVADHVDLKGATVRGGDYADGELGGMVSQDVEQIVTAWLKHAADRPTIAFTPNVGSAQDLCVEFERRGVKAEVVTGSTTASERAGMYARVEAGTTMVLVSVMVCTEGFDLPRLSCVLQCRPTRVPALYQQMVGRALRPHPSKTDALILDVVGATRGQKLTSLIDLDLGSDYDTSELDGLPCGDCGEARCQCPREAVDRDPDGGRVKLIGPAEYEDFDLLLASSTALWLRTHAGTPFLPAGDRLGVLWERSDGLYYAGHGPTRGPLEGVTLAHAVTLDEGRELVEEWALAYAPSYARRGASWRKGAPSIEQIGKAQGLGIPNPERFSKARLSDEINVAIASLRLDVARVA